MIKSLSMHQLEQVVQSKIPHFYASFRYNRPSVRGLDFKLCDLSPIVKDSIDF